MMGEHVIYMRGYPPPSIMNWPDEDLIKGAASLVDLPDDLCVQIGNALASAPGFMDRKALDETIAKQVADKPLANKLTEIFWKILTPPFSFSSNPILNFESALDVWRKRRAEEDGDSAFQIDDGVAESIKARLKIVLGSVSAFDRQQKARRLQKVTGQVLDRIDLICDMRPVFDSKREKIEGWIPLTHLKLVCTSEAGLPVAFEALLSEASVNELHKASKKAIQKLRGLREFAESSGRPVPPLEMTKHKESDDDSEKTDSTDQGEDDE